MSDISEIVSDVNNGVSASVVVDDTNRSVRNVQTQHGDYRTVDEENIVVLPLARCDSPEPEPVIDESQ